METTRLSTKGQIVLPRSIRVSREWGPGTKFTIEETGEGILLRPSVFPRPVSKKWLDACAPDASRGHRHKCGPPLAAK